MPSALDYFINQGLVTGKYWSTDSTGKKTNVEFLTDGKVKGFAQFVNYSIFNDLNIEPMTNIDEIFFDDGKKARKSYTFKITGDTLRLYSTKPNADSSLLEIEKLRYTLIRQR